MHTHVKKCVFHILIVCNALNYCFSLQLNDDDATALAQVMHGQYQATLTLTKAPTVLL